jgi:O-antigen/teichoic acid export membrane protein
VYWSLLITSLGFGAVLTVRELRRVSLGIDWHKCLAIVNFGLPFVPTGLLFFCLLNADRFFLLRSLGASEVGVYALGAKLAGCVTLVSTAPLFKVWTASMYIALARPGGSRQGGQMLQYMLVAYCFCGLGLCLFQKEVLSLLSTSAYSRAALVIAPLVAANGFMFAATFMECAFYVQRRTILKPLTALVGTIATVTLYATMIPTWGLAGAAYATLLGYATMAGITYVTAQRILHIRYNKVALLKLAAITVACYLPSTSLGLGVWQAAAKLGLLAVWIVAIRWTDIVTSQDLQRIIVVRVRRAKAIATQHGRRSASQRPQATSTPSQSSIIGRPDEHVGIPSPRQHY